MDTPLAAVEAPLTLERDGRRLFAILHRPASHASQRPAFLFCHPFAEEKKNSHRCFVDLARAMAAEGAGVLRLDFFGCGDSEGDFGESTIATRLADIRAGLAALRREFPESEIGLLGLRLGATLAAVVAGEDTSVRYSVLIEPVLEGRAYFAADLRRMLIKQMMTDGRSHLDRRDILARLERGQGQLDFDGYTVSGALYRELVDLDLRRSPMPGGRVLLVQIAPRQALSQAIEQAAAACRAARAVVAVVPLVMPPVWNRLDEVPSAPLVEAVTRWLREA